MVRIIGTVVRLDALARIGHGSKIFASGGVGLSAALPLSP